MDKPGLPVFPQIPLSGAEASQIGSAPFYLAVFNSMMSPVAVLDSHGVIVASNVAWVRFGLCNGLIEGADCIGRSYLAECEAAIAGGVPGSLAIAAGIRSVLSGELDLFVQDYSCHAPERQRWYTLRVTPLVNSGERMGAVICHEEVSPDALIRRSGGLNQLEPANESIELAKRHFLANMNHEMRTPLHQIANLAYLIRREPLSEKQRDRLNKLESAEKRLRAMVDGVLLLSELEIGQSLVKSELLSVTLLLHEIALMVQDRVTEKGLVMSVNCAPLPEHLLGDAQKIQTALLCFINNAISYTPSGRIDVDVDVLAANPSHAVLRFAVTDTGIGIAPQELPRLFRIFEQVDNSSTRRFGGTGVGLAMAHKLARLMGGDAGCDSMPGQGSTFWLTVCLGRL